MISGVVSTTFNGENTANSAVDFGDKVLQYDMGFKTRHMNGADYVRALKHAVWYWTARAAGNGR